MDSTITDPLERALKELQNEAQRFREAVKTAPNLQEIREGQFILFDDGVNRRIYTKIKGVLYYVALTAA